MKIKPKKIFNTIIFILFTFYISFYIASVSGYYEYEKKAESEMTEEKMKEFEKDIKNGKKVDIKKYLTNNSKKYDNKVTDVGNALSDIINNGITSGLEKTFKIIEKLIQ